jgi:mannose-6-phosphate isomerase-like protein (cupin superfamily)
MSLDGATRAVILGPGEGRVYDMGAIGAVFKADGDETGGRFSVSEWTLAAGHEGPGAHSHAENDEIFYVLEGVASLLIGETWRRLGPGSLCMIPRGVTHDFRNEGTEPIRLLNVFVGGPFEPMMPAIAEWYAHNPAKRIE